jgi:protein required for attachment to host cells
MRFSAETLLVLADGKKAAFFRNQGFNGQVRLKQLQRFGIENLASHEMGWDRPGRAFARFEPRRSAYEMPDFHEVEEARFLEDLAQAIEVEMSAGQFFKLVIMAPPRALGLLRGSLSADILDALIGLRSPIALCCVSTSVLPLRGIGGGALGGAGNRRSF